MNLLLDTNAFVYMLARPESLSPNAFAAIQDPANELYLSSISVWEVLQKVTAGKLELPGASEVLPTLREALGVIELPFDEPSAMRLIELPDHHRDPFDRMIVCQALEYRMPVVSSDRALSKYPIQVLW